MEKKMTTLAVLSVFLGVAISGCRAPTNPSDDRPTIYMTNDNALRCPLCKRKPIVYKMYIGKNRGFVIPSDADDPEYLYGIGCKTKECPVKSGIGYNVWREIDAVEGWNDLVRPWTK